MDDKTFINSKNTIEGKKVRNTSHIRNLMFNEVEISPIYSTLAEEGQENYYNYLDWLGLAKDPDYLILTSSHHYYFENEDLKSVKTIINLKQLNDIKRVEDFLLNIQILMPLKSYFIGSFTDNKNIDFKPSGPNKIYNVVLGKLAGIKKKSAGTMTPLLNILNNIVEPGTNKYMTEKSVRAMFENTGLKILDLTDFKGVTYFCTQKDKLTSE